MSDIAFSVIVNNDGIDDIIFKTIMLKGESGSSIASIEKTSTSGLVDTYTIYLDNGQIGGTFTVTNGTLSAFDDHLDGTSTNAVQNKVVKSAIDGLDSRVDALENVTIDTALDGTSTNAVQNKAIKQAIDDLEADAIGYDNTISGLVALDVQNAIDETLSSIPSVDTALDSSSGNPIANSAVKAGIDNLATTLMGEISAVEGEIPTIDTTLNSSSDNPIANSAVTNALNTKANTSSLATVATSGSYNDLSNKPTIYGDTLPMSSTDTDKVANRIMALEETTITVVKGSNMPSNFPVPVVSRKGGTCVINWGIQLPAGTYTNTDIMWEINPKPRLINRCIVACNGYQVLNVWTDGTIRFNGTVTLANASFIIGQCIYQT